MFKVKNINTLICCFLFVSLTYADEFNLPKSEDSLKILFRALAGDVVTESREEINSQILSVLKSALRNPESFDYPFDSLLFLGRIKSPDNKLRIFTWNYPLTGSRHNYSCILQYRDEGTAELNIFTLDQKETSKEKLEEDIFTPVNWYGALYYQVHPVSYAGNTFYTLIGFNLDNIFTNTKLIDILTFDEGSPVFGYPMFRFGGEIKKRVVFEYSAGVVMFLRYVPDRDMIVCDHLSPSSPGLKGQYRYYGPDFSYDGFRFSNGYWIYVPDIDWK